MKIGIRKFVWRKYSFSLLYLRFGWTPFTTRTRWQWYHGLRQIGRNYFELRNRLELHWLSGDVLPWRGGVCKNVHNIDTRDRRVHSERHHIARNRLHNVSLKTDTVELVLLFFIELQVVVKDEAWDETRRHTDANGGRTRRVSVQDCLAADWPVRRIKTDFVIIRIIVVVWIRKVQSVAEEERPNERHRFEFLQSDGPLQQLPVMLQRVELKDELPRIGQEIMVVILVS